MKRLFAYYLPILFIILLSFFLLNKNSAKAQIGEDTYPPGGSLPPGASIPPDACGGSCDCGASECDANCGCWCDPPCSGNSCTDSSDCSDSGGYNCDGGGGTSTCSDGGCSTSCSDPGGDDDDDDGGCTITPPTGLTLQTPGDAVSVMGDVTFSWILTLWGDDCDDPANNNWFEVCLGTGTTHDTILCPSDGGGGCHVPASGGIADTTYTGSCNYPYANLNPATEYHWYLKASNGAIAVKSSAINSFVTGGLVSGNVYQDNNFTDCSSAQNNVPTNAGWTISCVGGNAASVVVPNPSPSSNPNTYSCLNNQTPATTALDVMPEPVEYTISASPPPGWSVAGYCQANPVYLSQVNWQEEVDVYLRSYTSTWWQAVGADVWANNGGITSYISSGATNPYLLIDGINVKHGVAQATGIIDLGTQVTDPDNLAADSDDWGAENIGPWGDKTFNYDFWIKKLDSKLQNYTGSLTEGLWQTTGDITLGGQTISGKVFLITDGKASINSNITVLPGGSLVVVAANDIEIDPAVSNLQGYYISDRTISTGHTSGGDANQLVVEGGLIGITGVNLERNFSSDRNNIDPAEQFVFRPDILANINNDLKVSAIKQWQEIAP